MISRSIENITSATLLRVDAADRAIMQAMAILQAIEVAAFDRSRGKPLDVGSLAGAGMDILRNASSAMDGARHVLENAGGAA